MTDVVPTSHRNPSEWSAKLARAVNSILGGKTNNTGTLTLTANAGTTQVVDTRVGYNSVVLLIPATANAAAALASTYITAANYGNATFTVTHANNAQIDKTFKYVVIG